MSCYHPITLRRDQPDELVVPCGRCIGCRLERSRQWAVRCVNEASMHERNSFITLTYRDEELTHGFSGPILYARDMTLFFKRLRRKLGEFKYFACGEYGERTFRPHYHSCIFGIDFEDKVFYGSKNGINTYSSVLLDSIWTHGNCVIGDVTFESAAYVARYIMDKKLGFQAREYSRYGIVPEFVRMSRRPGIGATWFDKFNSDCFPSDFMIIRGGIKVKPPRYYTEKLRLTNPVLYRSIKDTRKEAADVGYLNSTGKQLRIREVVKKSKLDSLSRGL